ncbi:MAG: N-acetylmuramoyl-L-alanine amidase [Acutalibacteraceae bacterium]|nr:N-acetylmuramoyl-L-alanine amidase [Acutalibacteraceae bacterium]
MQIIEMFLTPNKFSRPQITLTKVDKIAVHYVGNAGSSAKANRNYFENLKNQIPDKTNTYCLNSDGSYQLYNGQKVRLRWVSAHFVIGLSGEIIQCIPLDEWSYCTNQANSYSISIECCHPDTTGKFTEATEKSLAELCAYLCQQYNLNPMDDIIRHYDVTGKQCPLYWSPTKYTSKQVADVRFKTFKKSVAEIMGAKIEVAEKGNSFLVRVLDVALNIRSAPGTSNKITGVIRDNGVYTIVEVKKVGGVEWGRLKSGIGWISLGNKYVVKL